MYPCPLKKPPSCWNLLPTSTVGWIPYQLGYWRRLLTALLHSLRHFAFLPTHPVCPHFRNMPWYQPRESYDGPRRSELLPSDLQLIVCVKLVKRSIAFRIVLHCDQNQLPPIRQWAVVWSILRICLKSRILWRHGLLTAEIMLRKWNIFI